MASHLSKCDVSFSLPFKMLMLVFLGMFCLSAADKENPIPVSDTGEGTRCDADLNIAQTCIACSRLPQIIAVKLTDCCSEDKAFQFCQICTKNSDDCLKEAFSINNLEKGVVLDGYSDVEDVPQEAYADNDMNKRFGTLSMGGSSGYLYGKRDLDKRYGRLGFGGSRGFIYGKRSDDKRFSRLGISGSSGYFFGKRDMGVDKRYKSLGMGGSTGFFYGKRSDDEKRFGTLGLGGSSGYLYGKRDSDKEKRFWRLGIKGSNGYLYGGKRKRFGQLGMDSSSGYFYGKH